MVDRVSAEQRSANMSKIRSAETAPERAVRSALFKKGYRFRKNVKELPGAPDVVLPRFHLAVFVHGCFWHGHSCRRGRLPSTNVEKWAKKIEANRIRDEAVQQKLVALGWAVDVIWTCQLARGTEQLIELLDNARTNV